MSTPVVQRKFTSYVEGITNGKDPVPRINYVGGPATENGQVCSVQDNTYTSQPSIGNGQICTNQQSHEYISSSTKTNGHVCCTEQEHDYEPICNGNGVSQKPVNCNGTLRKNGVCQNGHNLQEWNIMHIHVYLIV